MHSDHVTGRPTVDKPGRPDRSLRRGPGKHRLTRATGEAAPPPLRRNLLRAGYVPGVNEHDDTLQSTSLTSYRRRGGCLLTIGVVLTGGILAGATFGTQVEVLQDGAPSAAVWASDHQDTVALTVFVATLVASLLMRAICRQPVPPRGTLASPAEPERVSPAVAFAVATRREPEYPAVLPVLLDLIDRGYFEATLQPPRSDGGPVDLILAKPTRRPSEPRRAFERDVIAVFDALLQRGPGPLTTLNQRVATNDARLRGAWRTMRRSLAEVRDEELDYTLDLGRVRNGVLILGALTLIGGAVLAQKHSDDAFSYFAAFPITMAVGLCVPSRFLAKLSRGSFDRHARWLAYGNDLARRRPTGPPRSVPPESWSHDLALALAFSAVDAHWGAFAPAPGGSHWAAGLGDAKLVMLDHEDAAAAFGHRFQEHFDPPPSD